METERSYINVLKGLLIVLVVVGHFGQTIANNLPSNIACVGQGVVIFIYLFHMPLFLFVSGFLSKNAEKRRQKAFEDLFIPYVMFQVFVGLCLLILTRSWSALQNIFIPQMGAWYLLTLFCYRILLPDTRRIKGVIVVGVLLSVCACLMDIGDEFALNRTLGFFVYFMAGYSVSELPRKMIDKRLARVLLVVILAIVIGVIWKTDCYKAALSVLIHGTSVEDFTSWYIGPVIYALTLVATSVTMLLVMNALPSSCKWLERQGVDTMPLYLSHLILFMAVSFLLNKTNWVVTVSASAVFAIISIVLFSLDGYRKVFNGALGTAKSIIMRTK